MRYFQLCLCLLVLSGTAYPYSIDSVELPEVITSDTDVTVVVSISTPSGLNTYKPTQVIRDPDDVVILIYPGTADAGMIGHITETISLGQLQAGETKLTVVLVPMDVANWGNKSFTTTLTVGAKINIAKNADGIVLLTPPGTENWMVEYKPVDLPGAAWTPVGRYERWTSSSGNSVHLHDWNICAIFRLQKPAATLNP